MDPIVVAVAIKLGGSLLGASLALIYLQPKTLAEFTTRSSFSVISGMLFSEALRDYMKWVSTTNYELASSALTSMMSWFVMAAVVRIISLWQPK